MRKSKRMYSLFKVEVVNGRKKYTRVRSYATTLEIARRVWQTALILGLYDADQVVPATLELRPITVKVNQ